MVKRTGQKVLFAVLCCGTALSALGSVHAEAVFPEFELDAMVITATRTMKELQEIPSSVSVITAQDIQEKNILNIPEALQTIPGVYKDQTAQGGIMMRGFWSANILVMLDGLPVNTTYNNGVEWEMLPVENVERIEVVRGAGSSLYGGRAVAGVVNIITKDKGAGKKLDVNSVVSYGSNNTWKKALYADLAVSERVSLGAGYENRKSDGFVGYNYIASASRGSGTATDKPIPRLKNGRYILGGRGDKEWENENISANIKYDFDEYRRLKYTFTRTDSSYRYKNPYSNIYVGGVPMFRGSFSVGSGMIVKPNLGTYLGYDGKKESELHSLAYSDDDRKMKLSVGYLNMKRNGYSSPSSPTAINWTGAGTDSYYPGKTYNLDLQKAWENLGKNTIVAGIAYKQEGFDQERRYLKNWRDHKSIDQSKGLNGLYEAHGGKALNMALFIQDEYRFDDRFTMYAGLRYDHFKKADGYSKYYDSNTGALNRQLKYDEVAYNELSPKLSLNFRSDERTSYYVSYGHSFNPPPLYQIYRDGGGGMGDVVANPDLDPETSDTFEIGLKKKISEKTGIGVSLYHIKTKDKIIYVTHYRPGTTTAAYKKYENFGEERRKGVELEVEHKFDDKWGAYLNYTWQRGTARRSAMEDTNIKALSSDNYGIPRHLLHGGINYKNKKMNGLLECQYVSARQAPDAVTGEYGAEDAYFIVNTSVNYEFAKGASLQFAVENIFDKRFYAGEATSGRTFSVGLRYRF